MPFETVAERPSKPQMELKQKVLAMKKNDASKAEYFSPKKPAMRQTMPAKIQGDPTVLDFTAEKPVPYVVIPEKQELPKT